MSASRLHCLCVCRVLHTHMHTHTWEGEAGGSPSLRQHSLQSEFQDGQDYTEKPVSKEKKQMITKKRSGNASIQKHMCEYLCMFPS